MPSSTFAPHVALYLVYTVCFVVLSLQLGRKVNGDVYTASMQRFVDTPLVSNPNVRLKDVTGPAQVFDWISEVFIPQLYADRPRPSEGGQYCTHRTRCLLGEGDVDSSEHCAEGLIAGRNNCPSFMGSNTDCCEACRGASCKQFTVVTSDRSLTNSTSVPDVSASCFDPEQPWLPDLSQYKRGVITKTANTGEFAYCPEWLSRVESDVESRTAKVDHPIFLASHNQVLMGRVTMKRASLVQHDSEAIMNAYPLRRSTVRTNAYSFDPAGENTASFGGPSQKAYAYEQAQGFMSGGGFVQYIDLDLPKGHALNQMTQLKLDNWFDLNQGSLVLDLLLFNGNVETFMYVAFIFEHDFTGRTEVSISANPLDLSLHDAKRATSYFRFFIYLIILGIFCYFAKTEVEDILTGFTEYFSDFSAVMQLVSLCLCFACFVLFLCNCMSYTYLHFSFPLSSDPLLRHRQFQDLANLATSMERFISLLAVTTTLIVLRCIFVMAALFPQMGLVVRVVDRVRHTLYAFCLMYAIAVAGFAFAGYFFFGGGSDGFSTIDRAIVSVWRMTMSDPSYARLKVSDPGFAFIFWFIVCLFTLFVHPIMLAAIVSGYMKDKKDAQQESEASFLVYASNYIQGWMKAFGNCLYKCWMPLRQMLFGNAPYTGGRGLGRINDDHVARLMDRRSTRPRQRKVHYETKQVGKQIDIAADVKLQAVEPSFPGGLVQYYVEETTPNGPAFDARVFPGFRLVEIQRGGKGERNKKNSDREKFRELDPATEAPKKPEDIFKQPEDTKHQDAETVTLVFEGRAKACPADLVGLIVMLALLLSFVLVVHRVSDSYHQYLIHESSFLRAMPTTTHTANISFNSVNSMGDVQKWVSASMLNGFYGCTGLGNGEEVCGASDLNSKMRDGWFFWQGLNQNALAEPTKPVRSLSAVPEAVAGLTLGFLPYTYPAVLGELSRPTEQTVHLEEYNVGAMPNNQVILTFDVPCYKRNQQERWEPTATWILDKDAYEGSDASEVWAEDKTRWCNDASGEPWDQIGTSGVNYVRAESGGYHDFAGFKVGFGSTRGEAEAVSAVLAQDTIFLRKAASAVFEFFTYNANYDLFMHVAVQFGIGSTGRMGKAAIATVFPMNVFAIGNSGDAVGARVWNWICFVAYILASLIFVVQFLRALFDQYRMGKALFRPTYMLLIDFFREDFWNVVDLAIVIASFVMIGDVLAFILMDSTFSVQSGLKTWIGEFRFFETADLSTVDPSLGFGRRATVYREFQGSSAICAFLVTARLLRYCRVVPALLLVSNTIALAFQEIAILLGILAAVLLGFAFMTHLMFAIGEYKFRTLGESFLRMFSLSIGEFEADVHGAGSAPYWCIVLPIFQFIVCLVLSTMVGSVAHRWAEARRDAEDFPLVQGIISLCRRIVHDVNARTGREKRREHKEHVAVDEDWWRARSILAHINLMNDSGQIQVPGASGTPKSAKHPAAGVGLEAEAADVTEKPGREEGDGDNDGAPPGYDFQSRPHDKGEFVKAFRKFGMEKAMKASKDLDQNHPDEDQARSGGVHENGRCFHRILEKPQLQDAMTKVDETLANDLQKVAQPDEEVWLDALVTVLDEDGILAKVQETFRPPPTPEPRRHREIAAFAKRKEHMEDNLNGFLGLLEAEAKKGYYEFLGGMAKQKEKALKQQGLVLIDYLEDLEQQHAKLEAMNAEDQKKLENLPN